MKIQKNNGFWELIIDNKIVATNRDFMIINMLAKKNK